MYVCTLYCAQTPRSLPPYSPVYDPAAGRGHACFPPPGKGDQGAWHGRYGAMPGPAIWHRIVVLRKRANDAEASEDGIGQQRCISAPPLPFGEHTPLPTYPLPAPRRPPEVTGPRVRFGSMPGCPLVDRRGRVTGAWNGRHEPTLRLHVLVDARRLASYPPVPFRG